MSFSPHDEAAARRFPGPDYHEVLRWIHEALKPAAYVEIGILGGGTLKLALPETVVAGIDPAVRGPRVFSCTSNDFFSRHNLREVLAGKDLAFAFIDGLHLFEQALADFANLERYAAPGAIIALHDTIPLDRETSARRRTTEFHTGDVWKTVACLRRHRPDLDMVTVETAPTGLTLMRTAGPHALPPIDDFLALDYEYFERHHAEFLGLVPNDRDTVVSFCQKTPVQSISSRGAEMPSRRR